MSFLRDFQIMHKYIPEGHKGVAVIRHIHLKSEDLRAERLRAAMRGQLPVQPGILTQLVIMNNHYTEEIMMSDAPQESVTNYEFVRRAHGNILIAGLGIGMILKPILESNTTKSVTVIEKFQDVIDLVHPHIEHPKLQVIHADIFKWLPFDKTKYDIIYFDIWPNICSDNLKEMNKLHKKFTPYLKSRGWMASWEYDTCRSQLARL